jgi:hypothetical protein
MKNKKDFDIYHGPEFKTLDQTLQLSFYDFFNSLGINNDIVNLLEVLATEKNTFLNDIGMDLIRKRFLNGNSEFLI